MRPQHHVGSAFDLLKYNFISPSRPPTFIHASLRKLRQTFRSSEAGRLERATGAILRRHPPIIIVHRGALEKEDGSWRVSAIPYMGRLPGAFYPPPIPTHTHADLSPRSLPHRPLSVSPPPLSWYRCHSRTYQHVHWCLCSFRSWY